jgi:hypothetical protein
MCVANTYAIKMTTMILEAYSKYLQMADNSSSSTAILCRWLWERLTLPPETVIDQVLQCELKLLRMRNANGHRLCIRLTEIPGYPPICYVLQGNSPSGIKLLTSLHEFSLSYEQQKWARWVHSLKASDFSKISS